MCRAILRMTGSATRQLRNITLVIWGWITADSYGYIHCRGNFEQVKAHPSFKTVRLKPCTERLRGHL